LFRRQDFENLTVEELIGPLVSAKTLSAVRSHMTHFLELGHGETANSDPLLDVEVKLTNGDGSLVNAHYSFEFSAVEIASEPRSWMVRVTDITRAHPAASGAGRPAGPGTDSGRNPAQRP